MPGHADMMAAFHAGLRGGAVPPGLMARHEDELGRRFAIYRNNVAVSLGEALATRFPVIRRLVGEAFFAALARVYAETEPPCSPVLAEWGEGFAGFLAGFPPVAGLPYLPDVARIEFARGQAFHAADAAPVDPRALAAADPARVRLRLHPSLRMLRLAHPAVSIWARNQPDGAGRPIATGPEVALILRDAGYDVPVWSLGAGDAALIEAMLAGVPLAEAAAMAATAETGHAPTPLLLRLMQSGAVTGAEA